MHPAIKSIWLKKHEDHRILKGHPWVYSNEIDTRKTPLKTFSAGESVTVFNHANKPLGSGYINPHSLITVRLYSTTPNVTLTSLLTQRLHTALALRDALFPDPYYRLIFGEGDHLPGLIVDRFNEHLVAQLNTAGMELQKSELITALLTVLPKTQSITFKNETSLRQQEGLSLYTETAFGTAPETMTIIENGVSFIIPLEKGQKTGWFYDHRLNRARVCQYVQEKNVLDVFAYLGAFSIQAAQQQAKQVDCIDTSAFACDLIKKNAVLNHVEDRVHVICEDAFAAMKTLIQQKKNYDVIILDPPAFIKKAKDKKEGFLAYQRINELALKLLVPNGILVSCSCSMHLSMEDLQEALIRAANRTQRSFQILERGHQGPDHPLAPAIPEMDYLKMIILRA